MQWKAVHAGREVRYPAPTARYAKLTATAEFLPKGSRPRWIANEHNGPNSLEPAGHFEEYRGVTAAGSDIVLTLEGW
jgi:hypothetical protein